MHTLDQAIKDSGGPTAVASRMGITAQRLCNWVDRGAVPVEHCPAVEEATERRIRRWHLRPGDWHRIWPELIATDGAPPIEAAA
jgi:DNA-binding transcriptional regulator YdaS (Cro superfamily)